MTPNPTLIQLGIFLASAVVMWWGSGIVITAISSLARSLKISAFTISFFILGVMTSLPEMTIGLTTLYRGEPEIMVGNLVGGTLVLFLLIIPLLSLVSTGVTLPKVLYRKQLILALVTIISPALLIADRSLYIWEGLLIILLYAALFLLLSQKESLYEKITDRLTEKKRQSSHSLLKIMVGFGVVIIASQYMVNVAEYFAHTYNWSPFIVGLLLVAIGTNIPELSLVVRAAFSRSTEVALADYIGSAAANALLVGVFTIAYGQKIMLTNHALSRTVLLFAALSLFYVFISSERKISRLEGAALLSFYVLFVVMELVRI